MSTLASHALRLAAVVVASSAVVGCAGAGGRDPSAVRFAMTAATAADGYEATPHVVASRVLSTRVDLRQPLVVEKVGDRVDVRFGTHEVEGASHRLDPRSLATTSEASFAMAHPKTGRDAYYLRESPSVVSFDAARTAVFMTDEKDGRAYAYVDGNAFPISEPAHVVIGEPRAVRVDDGLVVAAWFAIDHDGCKLVVSTVALAK